MAILNKGVTFNDGDTVTSAKLNNLVDLATFSVPADNATIELSSGLLRLKDAAVTTPKINTAAVTPAKVDPANTDPFVLNKVEVKAEAAFMRQVVNNVSGTYALDLNQGHVKILTLTGATTFGVPTNAPGVKAATYILIVKQDSTGGHTLAWNAIFKFSGGVAPIQNAAASAIDIYSVVYDGADYYVIQTSDFKVVPV